MTVVMAAVEVGNSDSGNSGNSDSGGGGGGWWR